MNPVVLGSGSTFCIAVFPTVSAIIWQASSVEIVDIINTGLPLCVSKVWVRHVMWVYTSIFKGFTEIRYNERLKLSSCNTFSLHWERAESGLSMQYSDHPLGERTGFTLHLYLHEVKNCDWKSFLWVQWPFCKSCLVHHSQSSLHYLLSVPQAGSMQTPTRMHGYLISDYGPGLTWPLICHISKSINVFRGG